MEQNAAALDLYAQGWARGDINTFFPVLADTYTFQLNEEDPVAVSGIFQFFEKFRSDVAAVGGPAYDADTFMKFTTSIRRRIGSTLVEAAKFEVPGVCRGCYMVAASG